MSYKRVIPRDLFNESSLLFQIGHLYLRLEELGKEDMIQTDGKAFKMSQDFDGDLTVDNVWLQVQNTRWNFWRALNSRERFGMWVMQPDDHNWDIQSVFEADGILSSEFRHNVLSIL